MGKMAFFDSDENKVYLGTL